MKIKIYNYLGKIFARFEIISGVLKCRKTSETISVKVKKELYELIKGNELK
jgi:hypothetical protein